MNRDARPPVLLPSVLTALAYLAVGWLSLTLSAGPTLAAPLFPSAGIALACALVYGSRVLPAIAVGSAGANLLLGTSASLAPEYTSMALMAAIAAGAALQAAIGAALVMRALGRRLDLSEPRDVVRFFGLGGLLACTVSATVSTLAMTQLAGLRPTDMPQHWWTWWAGDTLGVLIAAPVTLSLVGRPRSEWAHRRISVGLSLTVVTVLLATASAQVTRWDEQRTRVIFERDASRSADALVYQLQTPLHALQAVRTSLELTPSSRADTLRRASTYWLSQPLHLQAIGWAQEVPRTGIPDFEERTRSELNWPGYRVFNRQDGQGAARQAAHDPFVLAIRTIEPRSGNEGALGVNTMSVASARPAVEATRRSLRPAASGGFRLSQETGQQTGVVVYQAVPADGSGSDPGVLFVTLRMEDAVRSVAAALPSYLAWCLVDLAPVDRPARLAGDPGCEADRSLGLHHTRSIDYAGRRWELRLSSPIGAVPDSRRWNAWLFSLVGLMSTGMLGALLLTVTGRTRRVEEAVAHRTADLRREVAERSRTEAALRESEQRFRNILDHLPLGLIYADVNGRIREANPRMQELTGYPTEELVGMSSLQITHPDDRAGDIEQARRLIAGQVPMYRRHKRYITRDGRVVWVQATVSALRDAQGRPHRLVGLLEDISEHLRLQEAERARQSAEAASRAKSDFVSRMSHELRTPLNAMLGFAQLLELDRQQPLTERQRSWSAQIQQAGWHLLHMINDTLDLSRIESGTMRLELRAVPLADVLDEALVLVEHDAARRGVTLSRHLDADAAAVMADDTRLKQVLINLLSNAVKYNVDGGRVWVRSRRVDADTVEVEVGDTGIGMTASQLAELFQPFNRLGREADGEGTGIGLVISRRLAELMEGSLDADSRAGEGSRFHLRLPAADRRGPPQAEPPSAHARQDPPGYHERLVHYIEDNETNAEVMRGILAQRPQVRLEVSMTGLQGLDAVRQSRPALVLLDMHLPDIDGLDLLRHMKADASLADIPVVVVSTDATPARIEQARQQGAEHYLTKPLNVAHVLQVLDELLERHDTGFGAL